MQAVEKYMSPRLLGIARLVPQCNCMADIGTDHGYIPIFLVQNKMVHYAIAADINVGPIERARKNISRFGLGTVIETKQSDGLQALDIEKLDTIVIAGMGGLLIKEIIAKAHFGEQQLVLQPMTALYELRRYLVGNGFTIAKEQIIKEGQKYYTAMLVKKEETKPYEEIYLHVGKNETDPLFEELVNWHIRKLKRELAFLKQAKGDEKRSEKEAMLEQYMGLKERMRYYDHM